MPQSASSGSVAHGPRWPENRHAREFLPQAPQCATRTCCTAPADFFPYLSPAPWRAHLATLGVSPRANMSTVAGVHGCHAAMEASGFLRLSHPSSASPNTLALTRQLPVV